MAKRVIPGKDVLQRWVLEGLTTQQMADRVRKETKIPVSRAGISMALAREGIEPLRDRHTDLLPWRVKVEHTMAWEARLLRRESRRRKGKTLNPRDERELDHWLRDLHEQRGVVSYYPDTPNGFYVIPVEDQDYDGLAPGEEPIIRRPRKPFDHPPVGEREDYP